MIKFLPKKYRGVFLGIAIPLLVVSLAMVGLAQYGYPYSQNHIRFYWRTRLISNLFGYRETQYYPNGKIQSVEHWKLKPLSDDCWNYDFGCFVNYLWADYFDLDGYKIGSIRNGYGSRVIIINERIHSIETIANGVNAGFTINYYLSGIPQSLGIRVIRGPSRLWYSYDENGNLVGKNKADTKNNTGSGNPGTVNGSPDTSQNH